jgi:hypothetical protein
VKPGFIELHITDLSRSVMWYQQLGFKLKLLDQANGFALLELHEFAPLAPGGRGVGGEGDHFFRLSLKIGTPQPGFGRIYFEVQSLLLHESTLAAHGILPEGEAKLSPEGYRRRIYHDPDDYAIGFYEWVGVEDLIP